MISKKLVLSVIGAMFVLGSTAVVAREASEGPRGADRVHSGTHKNSVETDSFIIARRGADDPVGSERPGEVHGQKRGGRLSEDAGSVILARRSADDPVAHPRGEGIGHPNSIDVNSIIIAREASEAPRGADNNNHRQRRGGRVGTEDAGQFILAREASEAPRGADNNNQRRRGRNA